MATETLTIRIDPEMRESLDAIAASQDRDRTYIVREALRAYIELYHWQTEHFKKGMREADEGKFVSDAEVRQRLRRPARGTSEIRDTVGFVESAGFEGPINLSLSCGNLDWIFRRRGAAKVPGAHKAAAGRRSGISHHFLHTAQRKENFRSRFR